MSFNIVENLINLPPGTNRTTFPEGVKGLVNLEVEGLTLKNEVINGDFSNGTTGWRSNYPLEVKGNTLTLTPTNQWGGVSQSGDYLPRHKYYISSIIKTSVANVRFSLQYKNGYGAVSIPTKGSGNWEKLSGVAVMPIEIDQPFINVNNGNTDNWVPISIREVMAIDLTLLFGSGNEPSKEWCDINIKWFDGIKSIGEGSNDCIISCGKNLIRFRKYDLLHDSVTFTPLESGFEIKGLWYVGFKVPLKPNVDYFLHFDKEDIVGTGVTARVLFYDFTKPKSLSETLYESGIIRIKEDYDPNNSYLLFYCGDGSSPGEVSFLNVQLEEGTTSTTCEEYKEDKLALPIIRRLPNGIKEVASGDTKNNGITSKVLSGGETWTLEHDRINKLQFYHPVNSKSSKTNNTYNCIADKLPSITTNDATQDNSMEGIAHDSRYQVVRISILKSRLIPFGLVDGSTSTYVPAFKAWLQANPTTVYYELIEPTTEKLSEPLEIYALKHLYSESLIPAFITSITAKEVSYIEPKLNWTKDDYYNYWDINRVENNTYVLLDWIQTYFVNNLNIGRRNLAVRKGEVIGTIPPSGVPTQDSNYRTIKDFIRVVSGEYITAYIKDTIGEESATLLFISFFDKDKQFLAGDLTHNEITVRVPELAKYMKVSYPNISKVKVGRGKEHTIYTPALEDIIIVDRDHSLIEFANTFNRVNRNIQSANFFNHPEVVSKEWNVLEPFDFNDANRWEKNLNVIHKLLDVNKDIDIYCGTFYCGEGGNI